MTYAIDRLLDEVAYVAYHFHWSQSEILDLEHPDRQRYVEQIGQFKTADQPHAQSDAHGEPQRDYVVERVI